jgi:hypothetical protein
LDCRIYLQNELKFAILTIGNLRNKTISEYTDISLFYEDKWFFPDIKEEFIRDNFSSFYEASGKNCMAKIEQLCSCPHSYSHLTLVYKLIGGGLAPQSPMSWNRSQRIQYSMKSQQNPMVNQLLSRRYSNILIETRF